MTKREAAEVIKSIYCEEQELKEAYRLAIEALEEDWVSVDEGLPDVDDTGKSEKLLISFANSLGIALGSYLLDDDGGGNFVDNEYDSFLDFNLIPNAWRPVIKPYREE